MFNQLFCIISIPLHQSSNNTELPALYAVKYFFMKIAYNVEHLVI